MKIDQLYKLVWMSRPLMQAAEACVEQGLYGTDLTVRMRAVLEVLRSEGDLTVPEIGIKLEINRQYVQLMVNETLASGFIRQLPNPRHRRSPLLALTKRGGELIDHVIKREMEILRIIGAEFSDEEVSTALNVVLSMTSKLKEQNGKA